MKCEQVSRMTRMFWNAENIITQQMKLESDKIKYIPITYVYI